MKSMCKIPFVVLAFLLCLSLMPAVAGGPEDYLGQPMPDFSVQTLDGDTFTLSEALQEKDAVLINLWATWCGPCEMEFPYLEEAYEQYQDRVGVIALSTDPEDTEDKLKEYAASHGLTFPVGSDAETGLADLFVAEGIPTTVVVDRFGNVVLIEVGAQPSAEPFAGIFELLCSDAYTETAVQDGFPRLVPTVETGTEGQLAAAVGMKFYVASSTDPYDWPFLAGEEDGKACIYASNAGHNESAAVVNVMIEAEADDVFTFRCKTSTETAYDSLQISLNGQEIKRFSGESDWTGYAVALEAGANTVRMAYSKDAMDSAGSDTVYLTDFAVLSGEEGQAALAANPVYAFAEETKLELLNEGARRIVFAETGEGALEAYFGEAEFYIIDGDTAEFAAAFGPELNPDSTVVYCNYDGSVWTAEQILQTNPSTPVDTVEATGYAYTNMMIVDMDTNETVKDIVVIADEPNADALQEELMDEGLVTGWSYADGGERSNDAIVTESEAAEPESDLEAPESEPEEGTEEAPTWTTVFVDQNGDPVPGCIINFCTDNACVPTVAGEDGIATFTGEPYAYHLQVIKVPEGYSFDRTQEFYAEEHGGEMTITVTRND